MGAILCISLTHGLAPGILGVTMQCIFVGAVALVAGFLATESAIVCCAHVFGWFRRDFSRSGLMLDGSAYREVFHPDGTWMRFESGPRGTICEWTDSSGAFNRVVTGPREPQA